MTDRTRDYFIQSITPPPQKIDVQDGAYYELCNGAKLLFNAPADAADILREDAFLYWKIEFDVTCGNADPAMPAEGYQLTVTADSITLQASDAAGVRNALRTLRQLAQPERGVRIISKHILPQCRIEDAPALSFRGMHICWFPAVCGLLTLPWATMASCIPALIWSMQRRWLISAPAQM